MNAWLEMPITAKIRQLVSTLQDRIIAGAQMDSREMEPNFFLAFESKIKQSLR